MGAGFTSAPKVRTIVGVGWVHEKETNLWGSILPLDYGENYLWQQICKTNCNMHSVHTVQIMCFSLQRVEYFLQTLQVGKTATCHDYNQQMEVHKMTYHITGL